MPERIAHRRSHLVSHVPGRIPIRIPIRFHREAHEALAEAIGLCERADRLRAEVSRIVADSLAADGQRDLSDQAGFPECQGWSTTAS